MRHACPTNGNRSRTPRGRFAAALRDRSAAAIAVLAAALGVCGCVERTMRISTRPPGATVVINDEEVGASPVRFSFLWYGDYEIVIRKEGYETLKTSYRVKPPWYQFPPFDLFAEHLVPGTIRDEHETPTFELKPATAPPVRDVVDRAIELRDRALYEGG